MLKFSQKISPLQRRLYFQGGGLRYKFGQNLGGQGRGDGGVGGPEVKVVPQAGEKLGKIFLAFLGDFVWLILV